MRYLIVGGTGSLGKKLISKLLPNHDVIIMSRDEEKHWTIKNQLRNSSLSSRFNALTTFVGDVRDKSRVFDVFMQGRPDIVIHAAALKHVDVCELSPTESIKTNLLGTENILEATKHSNVKKFLFVSTDKGCHPINVYGMCKALSEKLVIAQSVVHESTDYYVVRYGNVLESRGSIIPLFKYQASHGAEFTVTDSNMTRFLMTLDESVELIESTLAHGTSGETWIPILDAMRIGDLADIFSDMYNKPVKYVGLRFGEKLHEDLINQTESVKSVIKHGYYVLDPKVTNGDKFTLASSMKVLEKSQLKAKLTNLNIFTKTLTDFIGKSVEEIRTA